MLLQSVWLFPEMSNGIVNEAVEKFRVWLLDKYRSYCTSIVDLIDSDDAKTQVRGFTSNM